MIIKCNGKEYESKSSSLITLCHELALKEPVMIINGFAASKDRLLREGDEVFLISKGVMPGPEELEAIMAARHTPGVHSRLKKGRVAIAGLGGLGSNIAIALARIGVGRLLLVDFDVVEPSNLNRQAYRIAHLGMKKTKAMAEQIKEINPFIAVETKEEPVTAGNAVEIFRGYDIVCEAFDDPQSKAMLVSTLLASDRNRKVICGSGMAGYDSGNTIQTTNPMKNLYLCGDQVTAAEEGRGLMMPRVQICAGHQANMVLRLLLGIEEV